MRKLIPAVSAGTVDGPAIADLNHEEAKARAVDFNLFAIEAFLKAQASGKEWAFVKSQLGGPSRPAAKAWRN